MQKIVRETAHSIVILQSLLPPVKVLALQRHMQAFYEPYYFITMFDGCQFFLEAEAAYDHGIQI